MVLSLVLATTALFPKSGAFGLLVPMIADATTDMTVEIAARIKTVDQLIAAQVPPVAIVAATCPTTDPPKFITALTAPGINPPSKFS
jgi:hypothetical protein